MGYPTSHLATVGGITLALYLLWSMVIDPAQGPLHGRLLPLAVGVAGTVVGILVAAWGVRRIYR